MYTHRTPRIVAARRLTSRHGRDKAGRFLAEGAGPVGEALRSSARVHELYVSTSAAQQNPGLIEHAESLDVTISEVTEQAAAMLSETVTPQGIVASCSMVDVALTDVLAGPVELVAVLVGFADPGNAGTVLRTADAAGAGAVIFAGDAVDVHNGKCVRASAGSVFHVPIARTRSIADVFSACRSTGLRTIAADGKGRNALTAPVVASHLGVPTAWFFGNEAHGLDTHVLEYADETVRVPIYGAAESLNVGSAAAVCLYASAMAGREEGHSDSANGIRDDRV